MITNDFNCCFITQISNIIISFSLSKKVFNLDLVSPLIDWPEMGKGPRSIIKIGLHTHPPPPPQTFLHEREALGVPNLVCDL